MSEHEGHERDSGSVIRTNNTIPIVAIISCAFLLGGTVSLVYLNAENQKQAEIREVARDAAYKENIQELTRAVNEFGRTVTSLSENVMVQSERTRLESKEAYETKLRSIRNARGLLKVETVLGLNKQE